MSAGGLIRDTSGKWLIGFTLNVGIEKPLLAEIWALYVGLCLAGINGYPNVNAESDSNKVVQLINGGDFSFHLFANLLHRCRQIINRTWRCTLTYVYREANGAAHYLATMGQYHTSGLQILANAPSALHSIL